MNLMDLLMAQPANASNEEPYLPRVKMKPVTPTEMQMSVRSNVSGIPNALLPSDSEVDSSASISVPSQGGIMEKYKQLIAANNQPKVLPDRQQDFDKMYFDLINQRKENTDNYQKKLNELEAKKPTGLNALNLRPFLAFADSLNDTKLHYNYQDPKSVEEWKQQKEKLQNLVNTQSDKLSDDELGYLKLKMSENKQDNRLKDAFSKQNLQNEFKLRNEWDSDPITKNTKTVNEGYQKILFGYNSSDPATYMTMVYGLMKMQDPQSTVRESEFKTGEGIGGWPEQWKTAWQKATGDMRGNITELQKNAIISQARGILDAQMQRQKYVDVTYKRMADEYGLNSGRVVLSDIFKNDNNSEQVKEYNGKKYVLKGDNWVEVK